MLLDHLSYAAGPEGLAACVQRLGSHLGATFHDGGLHPSFGTRNFVLPLLDGCYLEVVAALDHPAAESAPFGRAVRQRCAEGGGWMSWVVRVEDLAPMERRLGRAAVPGHRIRPDGVDLRWRQIGVNDTTADPQLPYFVRWDSPPAEHPSSDAQQVRLMGLEIAGEETRVTEYLGTPAHLPLDGIAVSWVEAQDAGVLAALFDTRYGLARID